MNYILIVPLLASRVYNKRGECHTVKKCFESNVIMHVLHGIGIRVM